MLTPAWETASLNRLSAGNCSGWLKVSCGPSDPVCVLSVPPLCVESPEPLCWSVHVLEDELVKSGCEELKEPGCGAPKEPGCHKPKEPGRDELDEPAGDELEEPD
jgi:hypothetical protein